MADRKLFIDVLFELFKDFDNCDRLIHQFTRAYDAFNRDVKGFSKMSTTTQYYICATAARISIASSDRIMRSASIFRDKKKFTDSEINYSLEYGYVDTDKIELITKTI
jgi:hypothetical protein